jgi:transcriptional regulator with XRE-family HTH domain
MPTKQMEVVKMSFGDNLRRFRRDRGLTQAELATLAGLKITHMSKLENDSGDPKISTIYKLMKALECSADTLLMDGEKLGTDGILRASFERAAQLPKASKLVIIDLLDKYCVAEGMNAMYERGGWRYLAGENKGMVDELKEENKED